jgi:hypothetical protein
MAYPIICELSTILLMVQDFATIQIQSGCFQHVFPHVPDHEPRNEAKVDLWDDPPSFADVWGPISFNPYATHGAGI